MTILSQEALIKEYKKWYQLLNNKEVTAKKLDDFIISPKPPEDQTLDKEDTLLPGGPGMLGCFSRFEGVALGHYEATAEALKDFFTNKSNIIDSIARAARLPDLMHFNELKYHAQSSVNNDYVPDKSQEEKVAFFEFVEKKISIIISNLTALSDNPNNYPLTVQHTLFEMGTLCHLIQDLAVHQGITNPVHLFKDKNNRSPDNNPLTYKLAVRLTKKVFSYHFSDYFQNDGIQKAFNEAKIKPWRFYTPLKKFLDCVFNGIKYKMNSLPENAKDDCFLKWFKWNDNKECLEKTIKALHPLLGIK